MLGKTTPPKHVPGYYTIITLMHKDEKSHVPVYSPAPFRAEQLGANQHKSQYYWWILCLPLARHQTHISK